MIGLDSYSVGDTLTWGAFNHFSTPDMNNSDGQNQRPDTTDGQVTEPEQCPCPESQVKTGSHVTAYQRSFHEDIPITGTNIYLHYNSRRTADYQHEITAQVTGSELPPNLVKMYAKLEVGGHVFEQEYLPEHNVEARFLWDGNDILGNKIEGDVEGIVPVSYEFTNTYMSGGSTLGGGSPDSLPIAWAVQGTESTGV